jgi:hypothetical protein
LYTNKGKAGFVIFGSFSYWSDVAGVIQIEQQMAVIARSRIHSDDVLAPTLFYLRPKNIWMLAFQSHFGNPPFMMMIAHNDAVKEPVFMVL